MRRTHALRSLRRALLGGTLALIGLATQAHAGSDCNNNGVPDDQDIANGTSADCNQNGIPDECDIANGSEDTDGNGIPDVCERIYVDHDAPAGGDGTSWAHAYRRVQDALANSYAGKVQLWVAEGTYTPTFPGGDRNLSFFIPDGVSLYGGFEGDEVSLLQQDFIAHPTILSGDLNGNDGPSGTGSAENSYHVIRNFLALGGQHINGFHITGGHANNSTGSFYGRTGGGILSQYGLRWTLANCFVYGNKALVQGGGMYCEVVSPDVVNCWFFDNTAGNVYVEGNGAAIYSRSSALRCTNTIFSGNRARSYTDEGGLGGALFLDRNLRTTITNCAFSGNEATWLGAGIYLLGSDMTPGNTQVHNSILWGNVDSEGSVEASQLRVGPGTAILGVGYTCIQGLSAYVGQGNIGDDPTFASAFGPDGRAGTPDDDLHLMPGSPCIDAARNGYLPEDVADLDLDRNVIEQLPLDLDLLERRVDDPDVPDTGVGLGAIVDMGPYERQVP
jgi:hypothetical protein